MKTYLIPLTQKNKNGRIYTEDSIKNVGLCYPTTYEDKPAYCICLKSNPEEFSDEVDLSSIVGVIMDLKIEDNCLIGDAVFLSLPHAQYVRKLFENNEVVFRPRSIAKVNDLGIVEDCNVIAFDVIDKEKDAFSVD